MSKRPCLFAERSCYRPDMNIKRKRPSNHERLLKALLKALDIDDSKLDGIGLVNRGRRISYLSTSVTKQLIAIKESMEKKARKV